MPFVEPNSIQASHYSSHRIQYLHTTYALKQILHKETTKQVLQAQHGSLTFLRILHLEKS